MSRKSSDGPRTFETVLHETDCAKYLSTKVPTLLGSENDLSNENLESSPAVAKA